MDDTIQRYVEHALALADRRDDSLTEDDLIEIARELGLTDDDLARVDQAIDDHVDRGRGYSQHELWDDAIRELESARALAPARVAIAVALAEALVGRWAATDYPDDKLRATALAREALEREPTHPDAYRLLARLSPAEAPARRRPPTAGPRRQGAVAASITLVAVGIVAGVGLNLDTSTPPHPPLTVPSPPISPAVDEPPPFRSSETDLPLEFAGPDGIDIHTLRSRLASYPDRAFYTVWGDIEVTGELELQQLSLKVTLLDADGNPVKTHTREAWGEHEARLRQGDHGVFSMLLDADRRAVSARLEVGLSQTVPAKGPYAESPVVEPKWAAPPPSHLQLEIRERHAGFSSGVLKGKGFFKATWAFRNAGEVPIRALTYEVNLYDRDNVQLESKRKLATFSSHPPIAPGDVFLESTIAMIDARYARYELVVTEIE